MSEQEKALQVRRSPTRCPYCHDDVASADEVVCRECLARHHARCWSEHGACSTCGSQQRLEPPARPALTLAQAREVLGKAGFSNAEVDAVLTSNEGAIPRGDGRHVALVTAAAVAPFVLYSVALGGTNVNIELGYFYGACVFATGLNAAWTGQRRWAVVTPLVLWASLVVSLFVRDFTLSGTGHTIVFAALVSGAAAGFAGARLEKILRRRGG